MPGEDVNTFPRQPMLRLRNAERIFFWSEIVFTSLGVGVNTFADPHQQPFTSRILIMKKKNFKTGIKKTFDGWAATFEIGNQGFTLADTDTREEARWFKNMLDIALTKLQNNEDQKKRSKRDQ